VFKVVKNAEVVISDNDIKTRVLVAINNFFALDNWNFGDNFYFTELSTYVMNQLAPNIVNFVIVPKQSELSSTTGNSPYGSNTGLVTNPSNVPYSSISYSQINQPGRQWIYEYTLALASELLGLIRGKYAQIPAPGAEVTLNGADLIAKGKDTQSALREKLRGDFDQMSRQAQLERKSSENQSISSTLNEVPMFIYIG
jgi:hypothetical protein